MRDNVRFRVDVIAVVHHVDPGLTSLSRSLRLYQELLVRTESGEIVGERDQRAECLRARGAEIESGPRKYDCMPGYYAVFLSELDGSELELVHHLAREAAS